MLSRVIGDIALGIIGLLLVAFVLAVVIGASKLVADILDGLSGGPEREVRDEVRALREELRAERERRG